MTRTIQTAMNAYPSIRPPSNTIKVQIWPNLREAHDAVYNKGISRAVNPAKVHTFGLLCMPRRWESSTTYYRDRHYTCREGPEEDIALVTIEAWLDILCREVDTKFVRPGLDDLA